MDMNGSQRIEASREVVYAALNDVGVLRQCIPGCDSVERTSENELNAKVTLRIGPVKASFSGKVTLSDLDPPNGYTISGEGNGGMAGFAKGGAKVSLEADGEATILHYTVNAEIGGKLAQLGSRLIDGTAKKLAGDFFEKFSEVVAPTPVVATEDAPKKGWLSGVFGTIAAAFIMVSMSANLCCLTGEHHHEMADLAQVSICSSKTLG
jgi:uncharacterized protein